MSERSPLYLLEDVRARTFEPFASTRPVATLAAGFAAIWSRWSTALQLPAQGVVGAPALRDFEEASTPAIAVTGILPAGSVLANSRFAPTAEVIPWRGWPDDARGARSPDADAASWRSAGRIAAIRLSRDVRVEEIGDGATLDDLLSKDGASAEITGWWHDEVWDFIRHLDDIIADDIKRTREHRFLSRRIEQHWPVPSHVTVLGDHPVIVHGSTPGEEWVKPAVIEPHVVLDATAGPIYIGHESHVHAFTRINGPCYIGRKVNVLGGEITGCSIGDVCKVRGEVAHTVFLGYSNKSHDGFVGNSYLGRWVNLGASTVTSNLKNTYGTVALWTPSGVRDSGMQLLGTMFGDHVKTGIGLRLTTGCVLGAGANVYGAMPPKVVSPFAWGDGPPYTLYRKDKFIEAAARMMKRRDVQMTDKARQHWSAVHDARWTAETTDS